MNNIEFINDAYTIDDFLVTTKKSIFRLIQTVDK